MIRAMAADAAALASILLIAWGALVFGAAAGWAEMPAIEPLTMPGDATR